MRHRTGLWAGGLCVLFLVLAAIFHRPIIHSAMQASRPQVGKVAAVGEKVPEFEVTDLAGKVWKLSDLQKRTHSGVVSLTFWCTFCHSCRMMDGRFQKLADEFKNKAAALGVDASAADTVKKVEDFARAKDFTVPVFLDADGKVADLFGVRVTTTTVVIDHEGILRYRGHFGTEDQPHASKALRAVLDGKEVAVKESSPSG